MSDFLSWDTDLDLDLLLEEYTEYDPTDSGSDDYDCSTAKKKKTNTSATQPSTLTQYQCPVCAKTLKTISGFRGHTQNTYTSLSYLILSSLYINYIYQNLLILLRSISSVCYMYVLCSIVCIGSRLLCALSNKIFEFEFVNNF